MKPKSIIILLISVLIFIVMVQNIGSVNIRMLFWKFDMPLILLILLTTIVGFIIGYFLSSKSLGKGE